MNLRAKKSLGQHFLVSPAVARAIALAAVPEGGATVVEIGPGEGALTEELLKTGARVIAVEKDARALPLLREKFNDAVEAGRLEPVEEDILSFEPSAHGLALDSYAVAGNIPYYLTGVIIRKFTDARDAPSRITVMVQKEVALRMTGKSGWSILTLAVHSFGTPKLLRVVPAGAFRPKPNVDSAVVVIDREGNMPPEERTHLLEVARLGFAHKRKKLAGNLGERWKKDDIARAFDAAGIAPGARAEELTLPIWRELARSL